MKKLIYRFDLSGKLIEYYNSFKEASQKTGISIGSISSGCQRGTCVHLKHYFSKDKEFKIPIKKSNFNPLLSFGHTGNIRDYDIRTSDDDF